MLIQFEDLRYLSRPMRPAFPRCSKYPIKTLEIGGDNSDNIYWNATIAGDRDHRICGQRGTFYLNPMPVFGTHALHAAQKRERINALRFVR
jgi:hypothetical protein